MPLAAGTYRGRLGGQIYQTEDSMGLNGLRGVGEGVYEGAGEVPGQYAPKRIAMFGRTNLIPSLRQRARYEEKLRVLQSQHLATAQFQTQFHETSRVPTAAVTLGAVGLGGLAGALLAAALL